MILRLSILLIFVTTTMAAVSTQVESKTSPALPKTDIEKYHRMVEAGFKKSDCKALKELSENKKFVLYQVAALRHAENCEKKVDWNKISKTITRPSLQFYLHRARYEKEIENKNYKEAYRVYKKYSSEFKLNDNDFADMATKALKQNLTKKEKNQLRAELRKRSPRFISNPKKSDYRKVARDFRNVREFETALKYYRKVLNDPSFSDLERWKAYQGARTTYKLERWSRMEKYIKASKQWSEFLRPKYKKSKFLTKKHHDANIEYVRTLWTERSQKEALKALNLLEKEIRGRYSLMMVFWLKGRMAEERKEYEMAVHWLNKSANQPAITVRDRDRVWWSLAWNQRRIGQYKESQFTLDKLKKSKDLTFVAKTKYLYWQAENLASMGKLKEADSAFERLADFDPYGYYGALSFRKLKVPFPLPPTRKIKQEDLYSFFQSKDRGFIKALVQSEEYEISESFTLDKIKHKRKWSVSKWVNYLNLLQYVGAYKSFFIRFHTLPPKKQLAVMEDHPYLLFPQPYKKQVQESAALTKVSPSLIYSIMKQESGFDARARSHADAFGLLQLIPQVAKKAAQRMPSVDYKEPYDLYRPNVIIPLGANNLHHLFSKFKSNFILAVASYNASEHAVRGWIKSRYQGDPITFIEDIPYEETKGYVKLVMRNYITYNRYAAKEGPFMFPEVCLSGLDLFKTN